MNLEKRGVLVGRLAYDGFKFDPTNPKNLDKQLDDFCDAHEDSNEHDDVTLAAETGGSSCDEMEEIYYEGLEANMIGL